MEKRGIEMKDYSVTKSQIDNMKHTIGFSNRKVRGTKYRKYEAYRNFYSTQEGCKDFEQLVDLCNKGLMISRKNGTYGWLFHLSPEGFRFLSDITGVNITESEE